MGMARASKGIVKRTVALSAALVLSLAALSGCRAPEADPAPAPASPSASSAAPAAAVQIEVSVSVTGAGGTVLLAPKAVSVEQDATALEALQATGMDVAVTESSFGPFVEAIGPIANEGSAGWTYTVNGEAPQLSAGSCVVADGDEVAWAYQSA